MTVQPKQPEMQPEMGPETRPEPRFGRHIAAAAAAVGTLFLGGCTIDLPGAECPAISVLDDADKLTVFREGGGQGPEDVVYAASIVWAGGDCWFYEDELVIEGEAIFEGRLGAAGSPQTIELPYFVALTDYNTKVLEKKQYTVEIELPAPGAVSRKAEQLEVISIPLENGRIEYFYEVLIGFRLTEEQVQHNRSSKR